MEPEEEEKKRKPLPDNLSIVHHVGRRVREIRKLYNDIATKRPEKLIHQQLPNHMRRRAMSHNPKRLPRQYQKMHIKQMSKSGLERESKRPRKYRRRPNNLLKEYNRRKQKFTWLETHIWHAKRFKMKQLFGYKIPYTTTDKRYRSAFRAVDHYCLIQDISYYGCVEISGPLDVLKEGFKRITSYECGPTLNAICFMNGNREGNVDLFKIDSYPHDALARVSFLWKPDQSSEKGTIKTIWIFVHPGAYAEVVAEFLILFNMPIDEGAKKKYSLVRYPTYVNEQDQVKIIELKDTINRFRLYGPKSNEVLSKALKPMEYVEKNWIEELFAKDSNYKSAHTEQLSLWENIKKTSSPSECPSSSVLGLNIVDPRTNRSTTREDIKNNFSMSTKDCIEFPKNVAISPIWSKELRDTLHNSMISTGELCKLRHEKQAVPGIPASFEKELQPIPVLLVQQPHISKDRDITAFGHGWDLIVPAGYGLSVWLSLIKFGGRACGMLESEMIYHEAGIDVKMPDTVVGKKEAERVKILKRDNYFKLPPNKRPNYKKIGISSPFYCNFNHLMLETTGDEKFCVLRNIYGLKEMNERLMRRIDIPLKLSENTLIPINLEMNQRGLLNDCSIICLPKKRDVKKFLELKYVGSSEPIYEQENLTDENEEMRKSLKFNHKKQLKRLRNRRVRLKRKLQATSNYLVRIPKSNNEEIIKKHYLEMCELWLPEEPHSISDQCSREVFGYVTSARFSLRAGRVTGIGYITVKGLRELIELFQKFKNLKPFVITRATHSKCYYVANIEISC